MGFPIAAFYTVDQALAHNFRIDLGLFGPVQRSLLLAMSVFARVCEKDLAIAAKGCRLRLA